MHEFTICITYLLYKPRRNVMKCLNQIMQFRQTVTTIFSMPSSQRSSAGHHPSEALPKDLVEVLAVLKQHSFTQENLEMMWVSCIIALHCMTREDSIWYHGLRHSQYHWIWRPGHGVQEIAPNSALSLSPSLTVFGFALGEETHQHIDRKSDPGQGLKKPSHVQVLIYADFWAYWNSSTVSQLATNLWTR